MIGCATHILFCQQRMQVEPVNQNFHLLRLLTVNKTVNTNFLIREILNLLGSAYLSFSPCNLICFHPLSTALYYTQGETNLTSGHCDLLLCIPYLSIIKIDGSSVTLLRHGNAGYFRGKRINVDLSGYFILLIHFIICIQETS